MMHKQMEPTAKEIHPLLELIPAGFCQNCSDILDHQFKYDELIKYDNSTDITCNDTSCTNGKWIECREKDLSNQFLSASRVKSGLPPNEAVTLGINEKNSSCGESNQLTKDLVIGDL